MSGVSELLFRYEVTAECLAEACLNYEQYSSVMDPYAEDDDLEELFQGAFSTFLNMGKEEGVGMKTNEDSMHRNGFRAEEMLYLPQQVEISIPGTPYANGDSQLYMELNGVAAGLTSPSGSSVSMNSSDSPTNGASENMNALFLEHTPCFGPQSFYRPEVFDASGYFQQYDYKDSADVMHLGEQNVIVPIQQQLDNLLQTEELDIVDYHFGLETGSNSRSSLLRSQSSHTLGQDRPPMHPLSPQSESSFSPGSLTHPEFTGQLTSPVSELQCQQSDLQDMARAALMSAPSMRRAQSTGDLQRSTAMQVGGGNASPVYGIDTKRVGRFTLEERRQLLQRFQQKRAQRNFNKKIKYACRKSLADKRPRVRGRFARNDESTEHPSHGNGHKLEDDDEVQVDIAMGEDDEFLMHQSSSGDLSELLEPPVKLERLDP
ncbi:hypothetical protein CY35_07G019300 [Sphagnum magellanicum]|uniref:Uncharacterized protein n=2 Tax=Sphagnum magellanicum TaxID=128215 RepID=A0ACB8HKP2_9BRYO|nr:hypothetical protein CY35_07G019300 [Sphagnum magellanicum]KAH9556307.1 hypothetical protein CY35_07G019300 [Sphagnum magellanicum]